MLFIICLQSEWAICVMDRDDSKLKKKKSIILMILASHKQALTGDVMC